MTVSSVVPTVEELHSLSLACNKLWDIDKNRLCPGEDYAINLQQGTKPYSVGDFAAENLFTFVKSEVFQRPTYRLFLELLDNYERVTGVEEDASQDEKRENWHFLNAVVETAPMQYAYKWLTTNHKFNGDLGDFKRKLYEIWFHFYRREVRNDSSGFEHVFVGEVREGKVIGLHNWIQIYNEEKAGSLDYRGFIKPRQRGCRVLDPHENEQVITIQFAWEDELKPVSTSFIGVSPEFEMALYTLCFLNGNEDNVVQIGPYHCNVKCHRIGRGDRAKIGTAFPERLPLSQDQAATKIQANYRGRKIRQQSNYKIKQKAWQTPRAW